MQIAVRHNLQVYDPADPSLREDAAIVLPIRDARAVMGETIAAYLSRVAWRFELPTICVINGEYYARDEWATRALAVNDNIEFISRPLGSGSTGTTIKSIASVVALVALTAVAPQLGATAAGALLFGGGAAAGGLASIISAAIVGAGALAISYFLTPKAGGKSAATEALYSFGFQGNAARPMQPIPVLNGRLRFAPDYAAPTYSEYSGDAMIDYALYAITCGRWRPEQVLIGDTPIWDSETGPNPDYPGIEFQFVEPGEQVTLYPVNVVTADELSGTELSTAYTPGYIVNAAGTRAKELLLDFVWPGGAYHTGEKGKILRADTHIVVRVRPVDDAGAPTGPWSEIFGRIYSNAKQSQIRITERFSVAPGRYEVSARRVNEPTAEGNGTDSVTWTALRAHIDGPQSFPRVSMLAVKGAASKQLSGVSGGQLRVIGTRILPVWKDGGFVEEPTRSIAWAALDWWRNGDYSAGLSLSDTDFQAFVAYDALWASLGHNFDHRFTEVQNLDDVLETVLKAGRAFPAPVGDKLTITRDQPRGLSRMLFTENDIVRDSLEIDYALSDEAWADGMIGEYVDQTTWRLAEVSSAPDGVQLLKPARVQLEGIVDRKQATGAIRFMAAESQYRRITVSWIARLEGRLLKRGDLVKITAEEPETWGQSCEVVGVAANGVTLTLDPAPVWEAGTRHYVEIRRRDARPWGPARVNRGRNDAEVIVDPMGDPAGLTEALARTPTQERPWLAFSPGQPRTFSVLITEGDPDQDGEHIHLTGVIDAPEVYTTTEEGVPPLLQVPDLFSSAMPVILGLSAQASQRQLTIIVTAGWQAAKNAVSYIADISYDAGNEWVRAYEGDRTTFGAVVGGSDQMRVRVAGVTPSGARGAFYVVPVEVPDIVVQSDLIEGLNDLFAEVEQNFRDLGVLVDGLKAQAQQVIDDAIRQGESQQRQLAAAVSRLRDEVREIAEAAATVEGNNYENRQLLKVSLEGRVQDAFAAILHESELRISATEALAKTTDTLAVRLGTSEAAISTERQARIDADGVQAGQITTAYSRLDSADLKISGQASAQQGLMTRVSTAEGSLTSLSQSYTTLNSAVTDSRTGLVANANALSQLTTRTSVIESDTGNLNRTVNNQAQALTALSSAVSDPGTGLIATSTAVSSLSTSVTVVKGEVANLGTVVNNQAQSIVGLNSAINDPSRGLSASANAITSLSTSVTVIQSDTANLNQVVGAQATALTSLSSQVGGNTSSISVLTQTSNGLSARFSVLGNINGQTGGFQMFGVAKNDGTVAYNLEVLGGLIVTGSITGRSLAAQSIISASAQIDSLIVGNLQIADGAVTQCVSAYSDGNVAQVQITVRRPSSNVQVEAYFKGNSAQGTNQGPGALFIQRNGTVLNQTNASFALYKPDSGNLQFYIGPMSAAVRDAPGAGTHTYTATHSNGAGLGGVTIIVTELSK